MEDNRLDIFCSMVIINSAKRLFEYALPPGCSYMAQLMYDYGLGLKQFMHRHWYELEEQFHYRS